MTRRERRLAEKITKSRVRAEMRQRLTNGIDFWHRQLHRKNKEGQSITQQAEDMIRWLKEKLEAFDKNNGASSKTGE